MKTDTENPSPNQNPPRSRIICKGTKKGTTLPCGEVLCETDGAELFFDMRSGEELIIKPFKHGFGVVCEKCGYEMLWTYGRQQKP